MSYRGRLAPSPTGLMHLGHGRTFEIAARRAREQDGTLVLRIEDIDQARSRSEFVSAWLEDLRWYGLEWQEGPEVGGDYGPYTQSSRLDRYIRAFERLKVDGHVYPCACSRKDIQVAASAPQTPDEERVYPGTCRGRGGIGDASKDFPWRFRVPDGEVIRFQDAIAGEQSFEAGRDFGDFVAWRREGMPAYQLAVVVDDAEMRITEVVRGADLLLSTARQILLYRALGLDVPAFAHCPLLTDDSGRRLAKRDDGLAIRTLRERGLTADEVRQMARAREGIC